MGRKKNYFKPPEHIFANVATAEDLAKLDDAIHNHGGPFEKHFHELLNLSQHASAISDNNAYWSPSARVRTTTLRHCWTTLKWRPSKTSRFVFVKTEY